MQQNTIKDGNNLITNINLVPCTLDHFDFIAIDSPQKKNDLLIKYGIYEMMCPPID